MQRLIAPMQKKTSAAYDRQKHVSVELARAKNSSVVAL